MSIQIGTTALTTMAEVTLATAIPLDQYGDSIGGEISWASSDSLVASVGSTGWVTALSDGTASITASTGGLSGSVEVRVGIRDLPDETRAWEALCADSDSLTNQPAGIRSCMGARAWAWEHSDGKDLVLEVRSLQGSIGGSHDTADWAVVDQLQIYVPPPGDFGTSLAREAEFQVRGNMLVYGSPVWSTWEAGSWGAVFHGINTGPMVGCGGGGASQPANFLKSCPAEGADGFFQVSLSSSSSDWSLEELALGFGVRMGLGAEGVYLFCSEREDSCNTFLLDDIQP